MSAAIDDRLGLILHELAEIRRVQDANRRRLDELELRGRAEQGDLERLLADQDLILSAVTETQNALFDSDTAPPAVERLGRKQAQRRALIGRAASRSGYDGPDKMQRWIEHCRAVGWPHPTRTIPAGWAKGDPIP